MTLGDAWAVWWTGQSDPASVLWGMELLWWGRIGKALQLLAGATILAEIIGAPALRRYGNSLHGRLDPRQLGRNVFHTLAWFRLLFSSAFMTKTETPEYKEFADKISGYKADSLNFILAILLLLAIWVIFGRLGFGPKGTHVFQALILFTILFLFICPAIIIISSVFVFTVGAILDYVIIEPIAWALDRESLDKFIKLLAFFMLLIGFHFDFLAS